MTTAMKNGPQHDIAAMFAEQIISGRSFLVNKGEAASIPPMNPVSGAAYSGINRLILMAADERDPRWLTKNQAENQGYILKDGAKPRQLAYWARYKKAAVKGEDGRPVHDEDGRVKTKTARLERPEMRFYEVYHAQDLERPDGQEMPPYEDSREAGQASERVQAALENSGVELESTGAGTAGFYSPLRNALIMPAPEFGPETDSEYQALAVNALCGQISQEQGLAPDDPHWHQMTKYTEQHLQVAIASIYVSQELALPAMPFGNGPVNQKMPPIWAAEIEKDPYLLFRAAAGAEKIKTHFFSLEKKMEQKTEQNAEQAGGNRKANEKEPVKLSVPFAERGQAKELGAYFLAEEKLWVSSPDNKNLAELTDRWPYDPQKRQKLDDAPDKSPQRAYLDVPFEEKDRVKDLGAKFDFRKKQWYVEPEKDLAPFVQWLSEKDRKSLPVLNPAEEFGEVLKKAGLVLDGPPVMDDKPHKVPAVGQKKGEAQGTYCFSSQASKPSFYMNHQSGLSDSWTYSGQMLSTAKKAELEAELSDKKKTLREERTAAETKAVNKIMAKVQQARDVDEDHPYLKERAINNYGLSVDSDNNLLGVAVSIEKSLTDKGFLPRPQALITITPEGQASIEPKSKAAGAALFIGYSKLSEIGKNPDGDHVILVAEDYKTGASLYQNTGQPVAVAYGIKNMKSVAQALRKRLPESRIALCVNHDQTSQKTSSLEMANKIAASVGGAITVNDLGRDARKTADQTKVQDQTPAPKAGLGR